MAHAGEIAPNVSSVEVENEQILPLTEEFVQLSHRNSSVGNRISVLIINATEALHIISIDKNLSPTVPKAQFFKMTVRVTARPFFSFRIL